LPGAMYIEDTCDELWPRHLSDGIDCTLNCSKLRCRPYNARYVFTKACTDHRLADNRSSYCPNYLFLTWLCTAYALSSSPLHRMCGFFFFVFRTL